MIRIVLLIAFYFPAYVCAQTSCPEQAVTHPGPAALHQHEMLHVELVSDHYLVPFNALLQLYEFEFAPYTHKEVTSEGVYEQDVWSAYGFDRYLLYCGATPIGLAVINLSSMITGDQRVRDVAEFFIMPSHRRLHYGEYFAHYLFALYPGKWEVRQLAELHSAHSFWRRVIHSYIGDAFDDHEYSCIEWTGFVQRFTTLP